MSEKILLIEDDERLAELVQDYLGKSGIAVTIAGNGADGLAQHRAQAFDAVILDLMLPDMDGLEICRTLRTTTKAVWLFEKPRMETLLFDLDADPEQVTPIQDAAAEERMAEHLARLMKENDAPAEQFERLGFEG